MVVTSLSPPTEKAETKTRKPAFVFTGGSGGTTVHKMASEVLRGGRRETKNKWVGKKNNQEVGAGWFLLSLT